MYNHGDAKIVEDRQYLYLHEVGNGTLATSRDYRLAFLLCVTNVHDESSAWPGHEENEYFRSPDPVSPLRRGRIRTRLNLGFSLQDQDETMMTLVLVHSYRLGTSTFRGEL